jgi:hypothetical protein
MKRTSLLLGLVVLGATLQGCGGSDSSSMATMPSPPPQSTGQSLDTTQVLALAKEPSETGEPFAVNAGALTLDDTSEATGPSGVNGS